MGTERISSSLVFRERREQVVAEIVLVVPKKAERTPMPGAGFSPEAVPGKAGGQEDAEAISNVFEARWRRESIEPIELRRNSQSVFMRRVRNNRYETHDLAASRSES